MPFLQYWEGAGVIEGGFFATVIGLFFIQFTTLFASSSAAILAFEKPMVDIFDYNLWLREFRGFKK